MSTKKYKMSFTSGGLFQHESAEVATLYLHLKDWELVRQRVLSENLLQARKVSSAKRSAREVIGRLQELTDAELELLVASSSQDQGLLLWLAVCRRFRLVAEFVAEVIREKSLNLRNDLDYADFDAFFDRKSEWHKELQDITPATRSKLRQVLFRMLREASLLTKDNKITMPMMSPKLARVLLTGKPDDAQCFPTAPSALQEWAR